MKAMILNETSPIEYHPESNTTPWFSLIIWQRVDYTGFSPVKKLIWA